VSSVMERLYMHVTFVCAMRMYGPHFRLRRRTRGVSVYVVTGVRVDACTFTFISGGPPFKAVGGPALVGKRVEPCTVYGAALALRKLETTRRGGTEHRNRAHATSAPRTRRRYRRRYLSRVRWQSCVWLCAAGRLLRLSTWRRGAGGGPYLPSMVAKATRY
jgi:hypothetical protein